MQLGLVRAMAGSRVEDRSNGDRAVHDADETVNRPRRQSNSYAREIPNTWAL